MMIISRIIDANINRISEGLRVIEEYTRFIASDTELTNSICQLRRQINQSESDSISNLNSRETHQDARAEDPVPKRKDITSLLRANFKRVEEGCRVLEEYTGNAFYNHCRYQVYELEKKIILTLLKKPITKGVYLISHDIDVLEKGIQWGVSVIQLRDKNASKSEILQKAKMIKEKLKDCTIPFIINDFIDIALLVDADGVHTGQDDLDLFEIRKILGPHKILGRTTHSIEQGQQAKAQGADYVSVGPIWETPSKPGRIGIGFDYLKQAHTLGIPYVAIGGISLANIEHLLPYSPPMIGMIRSYQDTPIIQAKLQV